MLRRSLANSKHDLTFGAGTDGFQQAARSDTLTKGRSLMFRSGQTKPSNEVCAMLADKEWNCG